MSDERLNRNKPIRLAWPWYGADCISWDGVTWYQPRDDGRAGETAAEMAALFGRNKPKRKKRKSEEGQAG